MSNDIRGADVVQLAGWCAELAELVARVANDSHPDESDRAGVLSERIQHVADVIRRRAGDGCVTQPDPRRPFVP